MLFTCLALLALCDGIIIPLTHRTPQVALLALRRSARSTLEQWRKTRNNTHATEYFGDITVGGQAFSVLFDTGSDSLLLPGVECVSPACANHHTYKTNSTSTDLVPRAVTFGTGTAAGVERQDTVCLGSACGLAEFVETIMESDDPFLHAGFDGVLGLSLKLRANATARNSIVDALVSDGALPRPVFALQLSPTPRLILGEEAMLPDVVWTPLSEPGYWQFSLQGVKVGGKKLDVCSTPQVEENVTTFFGRMCCRTVEEFDHEERCQFHEDYDETGHRSRYAAKAEILAVFEKGDRYAVKMEDGCVQKVPSAWVSNSKGCRADGSIQALVDSGMSLMTAPPPLAAMLLSAMDVPENCTARSDFPDFELELKGGEVLTLTPDQYMDTLVLEDGVYCWAHLTAMPETAKGAVMVLGLPFLRAYSTVFDAESHRLGFQKTKKSVEATKAVVRLHGRRGREDHD